MRNETLDEQARHIAHVFGEAARRGARTVEPEQAAEDAWIKAMLKYVALAGALPERVHAGLSRRRRQLQRAHRAQRPVLARGADAFFRELAEWRAQGTLPGSSLVMGRDARQRSSTTAAPGRP
jgi:cyclohexanone monooxygenase